MIKSRKGLDLEAEKGGREEGGWPFRGVRRGAGDFGFCFFHEGGSKTEKRVKKKKRD